MGEISKIVEKESKCARITKKNSKFIKTAQYI